MRQGSLSTRHLAELPSRQPLTMFAATGLGGLLLDRVFPQSMQFWLGTMCAMVLVWWIAWVAAPQLSNSLRIRTEVLTRLRTACWFGFILFAFAGRHALDEWQYASATIREVLSSEEEPTVMVAVIDEPVRLQRDALENTVARTSDVVGMGSGPNGHHNVQYQTRLVVRVVTMRRGTQPVPITGRVMVMVDAERQDLRPGDTVKLYGRIAAIPPPSNPGETDQRIAARRQNIHARMRVGSAAQVEQLPNAGDANGQSSWDVWLQRWLADRAASARDTILNQIEPSQRGLALALTLGQRDFLDRTTNERLLVTGTAHLLSVSGLHLGIIVLLTGAVAGLLRLPLSGSVTLIVIVMLFYVAITGARPPVTRAAILLSTVILARLLARPHHPLNSLSLAAIILMIWMPAEIFGIGVQLSFLAVATLLLCGRPFSNALTPAAETIRVEERFDELAQQSQAAWRRVLSFIASWTGRVLWYSGAVTLMALPLVWSQFHVVSPISVIVNVMLSPLMALALSAGVLTILAGWSLSSLAWIPGGICGKLLSIMQWVIDSAANLPGGHFWLPSPPTSWVVTFYLGLVAWAAIRPMVTSRGIRRRVIEAGLLVGWIGIALALATSPAELPNQTLEATFVDVGHGTATILRPNRQEIWLYDCGWMGNANATSRNIEDALWSLGATHIDGIFLSHADTDHYNALPGLAERFSIGMVLVPPGFFEGDGTALARASETIRRHQIPVQEVSRGQRIRRGQPSWLDQLEVLHPPRERIDANDNANSLVLRIDWGERVLLLPGDLEPPGTAVLTNTPRPPPGGVIMAPHHGSLRMDAEAVLQWARPLETVVSGGQRAAKPEVTAMLSAAGGGVHVTSREGAIRVRMGPESALQIRAFLQQPW
ncbi:DNA internalization-like competence protein ComEC/Rec2 [Rhodopirellula islandica]|uniref:DNA internalization-like competence protein ComEC/Rec2 n=1 Tax=Rhodopirellula islandica TaxID=595434 RepID=A0A0J1E732_RHOIS|nr:ComEC/Rec2 family competence protein [Rhodopirellula islandica]KLU01269.1 DNA internalization-like competence protein ComEC/Rec2 [Rhodopirellula islandica]